jgi:hypothetical protein
VTSVRTGHDVGKGVAVTPDGRFLFVAHGTPVDQEPDFLIGFAIQPDGSLGAPDPAVPIGVSGSGVVITPDGQFLYVACQGSDEIWGFRIGQDGDLSLLPGMPLTAPDFSEGAAVAPDGRHLYVTALGGQFPDQDGVWAFAIGDDGALTQLGERIPTGDGPGAATATPDGRHVYISNFRSDDISAYDVLPSGRLRELAGSPFPSGGEGPAFGAVMVPPDQGPEASFSATARPAGRATRFDASDSADRDGRIVRYDWDFGDGTVGMDTVGMDTVGMDAGPTPTHTYRQPSTFEVTVTVTDNEGCSTEFVFAGQSPLCTGSALARATRTVVITG